ncbi:MAG: hypothetical protein E4H39_01130 [Syntrophobacterales bacterium]|nr:MAG: hypothetical protein E4H39_01130 [Syntrophobacterales bacterium]
MTTSGKERQRKYIEKKRLEGKSSVTILLSQVTKDILSRERKKTGESLSTIIERAVTTLDKPITIDITQPPAPTKTVTRDESRKKKKTPKQGNLELF